MSVTTHTKYATHFASKIDAETVAESLPTGWTVQAWVVAPGKSKDVKRWHINAYTPFGEFYGFYEDDEGDAGCTS